MNPGPGVHDRAVALPCLLPWQAGLLAAILGIWAVGWPLPSVLALLFLILFLPKRTAGRAKAPIILPAAFCLGFLASLASLPPYPQNLPDWIGKNRLVTAKVAEADTRPMRRLRLVLKDIRSLEGGKPLPGRAVLNWDEPEAHPLPGQRLTAELRFRPLNGMKNPGNWDYEAFWQRRGVFFNAYARGPITSFQLQTAGTVEARLHHLRHNLLKNTLEILEKSGLSQAEALLPALLFGERFHLDSDTVDLFSRSSLAHSLALSGLHLGCVASLGLGLAWAVGFLWPGVYLILPRHRLAVLLAAPLVASYLWLGQFQPSLCRAAVMYAAFGLLLLLGRPRVLMDGLFLAVAVLLAINPLAAYETSLQFSAGAVAGIALLLYLKKSFSAQPRENQTFSPGQWISHWALGLICVSLAVNLTLLPAFQRTFGTVSPHLYLNLLWLPVLGFWVLPVSLAGLALSLATPDLAAGLFSLAAMPCHGLLELLSWMDTAGILEPNLGVRPLWPAMLGYWILLLALILAPFVKSPRRWALPAVAGLTFLLAPGLYAALQAERETVSLRLLDVGQGQSVLLDLPGGRRILLDGSGAASPTFDIGEAVVAPVLTLNQPPRLERVLLSHPHLDHAQGLKYILRHFQVKYFAGNEDFLSEEFGLKDIVRKAGLQTQFLSAPGSIDLGGGLSLEVLHPGSNAPGSLNDRSLVLRLVQNGKGLALLPGDNDDKGIAALLNLSADLSAEVLVLPHHGSGTKLDEEFYDAVKPAIALVSAGCRNRWGFPSHKTTAILKRLGVPLFWTCTEGAVEVVWRNNGLRVHSARRGKLF